MTSLIIIISICVLVMVMVSGVSFGIAACILSSRLSQAEEQCKSENR